MRNRPATRRPAEGKDNRDTTHEDRTNPFTTDPDAKLQRSSQRIAIEQNYERVRAQYDARLADALRARLVRPPDVPAQAPTLDAALAVTGCTASR